MCGIAFFELFACNPASPGLLLVEYTGSQLSKFPTCSDQSSRLLYTSKIHQLTFLFFFFLKQHLNIERITEALCPSVKLQPGMLQSILLRTTVYVCYPTITISRGHKRGMTPLEIPSLLSPSTCWRSLWPEAQLDVPQMQCLRGGLTLQLQIDLLTSQSISTIDKACQEHDNHYFPEKVQFKQVGPKSSTPSTIKQLTWLAHHSPLWLQCKPFPNERQQLIKFPSYDADCPGRAKVDTILTWKYIPGLQLLSTFCNSLPNNTICAIPCTRRSAMIYAGRRTWAANLGFEVTSTSCKRMKIIIIFFQAKKKKKINAQVILLWTELLMVGKAQKKKSKVNASI